MKKLLLLLTLLLGGCNTELVPEDLPELRPVWILQSEHESQTLRDAIAEWNSALPDDVFEYSPTRPDGDWYVEIIYRDNLTQQGQAYGDCDQLCVIVVPDNLPEDQLTALLTHELGHCLGIPHSTNADSIMFTHVNPTQSIYPEDVQSVCSQEYKGVDNLTE